MTPTERHNLIDARLASIADRLIEARAQYALDGLTAYATTRNAPNVEPKTTLTPARVLPRRYTMTLERARRMNHEP